jgi:hypothetical protein
MPSNQNNRIFQLKFIANIFNLSLKEIKDTLGFETLTMIFRRVGEENAVNIVKQFKGKYKTVEEFCKLIVEQVIEPIIGKDQGKIIIDGEKVIIELNQCPYKKAGGYPIKEMGFFCHYTEGLFDNALKLAFPDKKFNLHPNGLISESCEKCRFEANP